MILVAVAAVIVTPVIMIAGRNRAVDPAVHTAQLFKGSSDEVNEAVLSVLDNSVSMESVADDFYWALLNGDEKEKIFLIESFVTIAKMNKREDYADGEILLHITLLALGAESDVQAVAKNALEALQ